MPTPPKRPAPPQPTAADWNAETARRNALLDQMGYKSPTVAEKPKPKTPYEFMLHLLQGGGFK